MGSAFLTWRRQELQVRVALLPRAAELVDEGVDFHDLPHMDLQQWNAIGRKDIIDQLAVACLAAGFAGAVVLEFDCHHGQPIYFAVDEEVDVTLADFKEAHRILMVKDFAEAGLALNVAALGGNVFEAGVKQRFVRGKKGIGGG